MTATQLAILHRLSPDEREAVHAAYAEYAAMSPAEQAAAEVAYERRLQEVEQHKQRLREHKPWWHHIFPYRIKLERRP